jgi:sulfur-oxidizing protein SoxY
MIATRPPVLSRRAALLSGAAMACAPATIFAHAARADETLPERTVHFEEALRSLLAGREPVAEGVTIEIPEIAENGNFVPVTIGVDSPMTAEDHVKTIHLLSSGNPVAKVATFQLSPANGVARIQSRMRLARTQDVVVVTEHADGALRMAATLVKVTIGGCAT